MAFVANFEPWGGSSGIYLSPELFQPLGGPARALWVIYYLMVGVMGLSLYLSYAVKRSKFGLGLRAIGQNEDAASVLGVVRPATRRPCTACRRSCRRSPAASTSSRARSSSRRTRLTSSSRLRPS